MSEYNEPWKAEGRPDDTIVIDQFENTAGVRILVRTYGPAPYRPDMRDRIIACVNACAGVDTEILKNLQLQPLIEGVMSGNGNIDCGYCGISGALEYAVDKATAPTKGETPNE